VRAQSINFPPKKCDRNLCLPSHYWGVGIISLPLLHIVIYIGLAYDKFCLCFTQGKAHGLKCRAVLGYRLLLGPLFWQCPILGLYPTQGGSLWPSLAAVGWHPQQPTAAAPKKSPSLREHKSDLSCWGFLGLMMGGKYHSTFADSAIVYWIINLICSF